MTFWIRHRPAVSSRHASPDCTDRAMRIFPVDNALLPLSEQGALWIRTTAAPTTQIPGCRCSVIMISDNYTRFRRR